MSNYRWLWRTIRTKTTRIYAEKLQPPNQNRCYLILKIFILVALRGEYSIVRALSILKGRAAALNKRLISLQGASIQVLFPTLSTLLARSSCRIASFALQDSQYTLPARLASRRIPTYRVQASR